MPVVEGPDLSRPRRIHVVGAGGAGMGPIATILAAMGHRVSASDRADSPALRRLADHGIDVGVGHDRARVAGVEIVTASTAVPDDDPELVEAAWLGIDVVRRALMLAGICAQRRCIAVAGTKGKTTTTAMLSAILDAAGWRPSFLVGGDVPGVGGGARWVPDSEWFVVEADESDGTFLALPAEAVVVTNLEPDHLDHWGSMAHLAAAFGTFLASAPGPQVVGIDSPAAAALVSAGDLARSARTYGTSAAAAVEAAGAVGARHGATFSCVADGRDLGVVRLAVPGLHNVRNACGALATAMALGVDFATASGALGDFRPVARRFESRGEWRGATIVDDYAHLPSAVRVVLETARDGGWERLVAVFQPHLYTRTALAGAEIGASLAIADVVVVTDVYGAREAPMPGVTGALVADAVRGVRGGVIVVYVPERDALASVVAELLRPGDLCLTLGAGDITNLAAELAALG